MVLTPCKKRRMLEVTLEVTLGQHSSRHLHSIFDLNAGKDLLEAETILQDVIQRRRRVFGPAHPETRTAEFELFKLNRRHTHGRVNRA